MIECMISNAHNDIDSRNRSVNQLVDRFGSGPVTVLGVWAHPDDESFLAGGLLAEVTRRGGRVVTVTATAGEHGIGTTADESPSAVAARRVAELDAALEVLGGEAAIHLGYADGGCDQVSDHLAVQLMGQLIDRIEPDVIVTFGPDGVTGHPDHQAVGRWIGRAVAERGDDVPVVSTTAASAWHDEGIDRLHSIEAFWPGFPEQRQDGLVVSLDDELVERKLAAIACHASQMTPVHEALGPDHLRQIAAVECYVAGNRAASHHLSPELERIAA
jgi:LmbE family N-acetylglucosaminyl deacetylase